jgi:hypothetical protein
LKSASNVLRSRLGLLLVLVAVFALALAGPQQIAARATCPNAAYVDYYSNASETTVVGMCHHACCELWTCTGTLTNYSKVILEISCNDN